MNRPLPVTLVGGFLGAGKTSLLHHFISEHATAPLAIFVESLGGPNLDAKAVRGLCGAMRRTQDLVLEIPAGEESEQIDWLVQKLKELSGEGRFERALIEVSGTTNPARLGRCFGFASDRFAPGTKLDQIICVIDALDFYRGVVAPLQRGLAAQFLDFQQAQIEGATLLVLNKCDLVEDAERNACLELLGLFNSSAPMAEIAHGELASEIWMRAATNQELNLALKEHSRPATGETITAPETENPELSSLLYRVYRPFHPGRFWDWFEADHPGLLRVKGIVWLATRNLLVGGISRTRWQNSCGGAGIWWAALPREEWPIEPESLVRMQETWREPFGDRRQELILLGDARALPEIARRLAGCLLSDDEYARPTSDWLRFSDPFPAWDVGEES